VNPFFFGGKKKNVAGQGGLGRPQCFCHCIHDLVQRSDLLTFAAVFTLNLDGLGFSCAAGGSVMRYASTAIFFWLVLCISASILGVVVSCWAVGVESHMLNTTQSLLEGKAEEIYDATG